MKKQEYDVGNSRTLHTGFPEDFGFEFHRREMERTAVLVPDSTPMLDLGCGSGLISRFIPSHIAYLGLDFNRNYLSRDWMGRDVDGRVCGNILELPIRDRCLKTVLLLHVIEHLPGSLQGRLLQEIHRVLEGDGTLVLSTPNLGTFRNAASFLPPNNPKHFRCLTLGEARKLLEVAGFQAVSRHGFDIFVEPPNSYVGLIPVMFRRQLAHMFLPLEKHLILTAKRN
jgi:SAM-dependent methyltransferase